MIWQCFGTPAAPWGRTAPNLVGSVIIRQIVGKGFHQEQVSLMPFALRAAGDRALGAAVLCESRALQITTDALLKPWWQLGLRKW